MRLYGRFDEELEFTIIPFQLSKTHTNTLRFLMSSHFTKLEHKFTGTFSESTIFFNESRWNQKFAIILRIRKFILLIFMCNSNGYPWLYSLVIKNAHPEEKLMAQLLKSIWSEIWGPKGCGWVWTTDSRVRWSMPIQGWTPRAANCLKRLESRTIWG